MLNIVADSLISIHQHLLHWKDIAFRWQDLIGAIISGLAAFGVWWVSRYFEKRDKRKDEFDLLKRLVELQLQDAGEARSVFIDFINTKIETVIADVQNAPDTEFTNVFASIPEFPFKPFPEQILNIRTGSGYVDLKVYRAYMFSRQLNVSVADAIKQHEITLEQNRDLIRNTLGSPQNQRASYIRNLRNYQTAMRTALLGANLPNYIQSLIKAAVSLNEYEKLGRKRWVLKLDPRFKFFWTRRALLEKRSTLEQDMDKYFEQSVVNMSEKFEEQYQ